MISPAVAGVRLVIRSHASGNPLTKSKTREKHEVLQLRNANNHRRCAFSNNVSYIIIYRYLITKRTPQLQTSITKSTPRKETK